VSLLPAPTVFDRGVAAIARVVGHVAHAEAWHD
jgi:hypothetical protein